MKAVRLKSAGHVAVEQVARPVPEEGEVLLRVLAAGVCRTDCHLRAHPFAGQIDLTLGHEIAGEIAELGPGVVGRILAERVVVHPCWACHRCPQCLAGRENYCQGGEHRRSPPPTPGVTTHGGMAEFVVVPASALVPIGTLDPAFAAILADAGLAPYHSVRLLRDALVPGTAALVTGLGGLGRFAVQFLAALTPARIIAVDLDEGALAAARSLGAHETLRADDPELAGRILDLTDGRGVEAVIDFVGIDATLRLAAAVVAPGGAIQMVGLSGGSLPVEAGDVSTVGLPWGATVSKPYSGSYRDLAEVIALAREGRLTPRIERFGLDDAVAALDRLEQGGIDGRAVLVPA
ncbi:alcohol dehydrogenase catalytic domain-containing protein [Novosphingobium colocasiae]|uniref:Oxidoreductase n=1 Tax=Novosphingobium colocasiae TaxID=1256513 RepID=A0A918UJ12_9SPHN|nr:alcohol dehydrogenase catalytic domain-containing protein [Novosphingobium colocasiae]GGZ13261.1 oxidoreductase [Novosphingobium colocasiae]